MYGEVRTLQIVCLSLFTSDRITRKYLTPIKSLKLFHSRSLHALNLELKSQEEFAVIIRKFHQRDSKRYCHEHN